MKTMKKMLALFLTMLLVFSSVSMLTFSVNAFENQIVHQGEPRSTTDGSVTVSKTIEQTGENEFRINLTIDAKDKVSDLMTSNSADVVLVIDISNSMAGDRLTAAKQAAVEFVNTMFSTNSAIENRIGIVTYNRDGHDVMSLTSDKAALLTAISQIELDSDTQLGSTNIHDGLMHAEAMLATGSNSQKYVVLLSDGQPTMCQEVTAIDTSATAQSVIPKVNGGYYDFLGTAFSTTSRKGTGKSSTYTSYEVGGVWVEGYWDGWKYIKGHWEGRKSINDTILPTLSQAYWMKQSGIEIYSVLFMDSTEEGYNTAKHVMRNVANDAAHYTNTSGLTKLAEKFKAISQEILEKANIWSVVDPIPPQFIWGGVDEGSSDAGATYTSSSAIFTWSIANSGVSPVAIEGGKWRYTLSYDLTLDPTVPGFVEDQPYATNGTTTLTYFFGNMPTGTMPSIDFDVPTVKGKLPRYAYTVNYYKQQQDGSYQLAESTTAQAVYNATTPVNAPDGYQTHFENYIFNTVLGNTSIIVTGPGMSINLYYDLIPTNVTVYHEYFDVAWNADINTAVGTLVSSSSAVYSGRENGIYVGNSFTATPNAINGYTCFTSAADRTITLSTSGNAVIVIYKKQLPDPRVDTSVTVNHLYYDVAWNEDIATAAGTLAASSSAVYSGRENGIYVGNSFTATPNAINGYTCYTNAEGRTIASLAQSGNVINIIYKKQLPDPRVDTSVTVNHLYYDVAWNEDIATATGTLAASSSAVYSGRENGIYVGNSFTATPNAINGYICYTDAAGRTIASLAQNGNVINIIYKKQLPDPRVDTSVTVEHYYYEVDWNQNFANGEGNLIASSSAVYSGRENGIYVGNSFTATAVPNGYTQYTDNADLTITLQESGNKVVIQYTKSIDTRTFTGVVVNHQYYDLPYGSDINTGTGVLNSELSQSINVTGDAIYVGATYSAIEIPVSGYTRMTSDTDMTITVAESGNVITIIYKKILDKVDTTVTVNHIYQYYAYGSSTPLPNNPLDYSEVVSGPAVYVGASYTAIGNPQGYTQLTTGTDLTITDLAESGNIINIYYEDREVRTGTTVTVRHEYYDYAYGDSAGTLTASSSAVYSGIDNGIYVGNTFTATREAINGYTFESADPSETITLAASGNAIVLRYGKRENRQPAEVTVRHEYYDVDWNEDISTAVGTLATSSTSVYSTYAEGIWVGNTFTASPAAIGDYVRYTPDADLTIEIQPNGNLIVIVYKQKVDTRIGTTVTVTHQYYEVIAGDSILDGTLVNTTSQNYSTFAEGVWVGNSFTATRQAINGFAFDSAAPSETIILSTDGSNEIIMLYRKTVEKPIAASVTVTHNYYVVFGENSRVRYKTSTETFTGDSVKVGEAFTAELRNVEPYKFVSASPAQTITVQEGTNQIVLDYEVEYVETSSTPTVDIPESSVPLNPTPSLPESSTPTVDIPEESVPLEEAPDTGAGSMTMLYVYAVLAFFSAAGLVTMVVTGKKTAKKSSK